MAGLLQTAGAIGTGLAKTGEQAMSLAELISQQKHRAFVENMATQQLSLEKQKAADVHSDFQQKQRIQGFQEKQLAEQEKARKAPMDITVHPMYLALPEAQRPEVLKYFQSTGAVDERGVGESGRIMNEVDKIEKSEPLFKQFMTPTLEAQKKKITDLYEKIQKNPDDEKLQKEYQAEFNKYQMATGEFTKHISKLQEIQATAKGKERPAEIRAESQERIAKDKLAQEKALKEKEIKSREDIAAANRKNALDIAQSKEKASGGKKNWKDTPMLGPNGFPVVIDQNTGKMMEVNVDTKETTPIDVLPSHKPTIAAEKKPSVTPRPTASSEEKKAGRMSKEEIMKNIQAIVSGSKGL